MNKMVDHGHLELWMCWLEEITVGQMGMWTSRVLKLTFDEVKSLRNRITNKDFVDFTRKGS